VLAAGLGAVWLGDAGDKTSRVAYRYDPVAGSLAPFSIAAIGTFGSPDDLAVAGGALWVGCETILRMTPDGESVTAKVELPGAFLAVGEGQVWAAGTTGALAGQAEALLWQLDPLTAAVLSETEIEPGVVDLAVGAGAVWIVRLSDDSITRVDTATRAVTEAFRVRLPDVLAARDSAVWVTSSRDGTLTRFDSASADLRTIEVGGTPYGLAVGTDAVWVGVQAA
jgi:streptogramin lyase